MIQWKMTKHRRGEFEGYTVYGFHYESLGLETPAWHVKVWETGFSSIHDYWVVGIDFYSLNIHYMVNGTDTTLIELSGVISNVPPEDRSAALKAIGEWDREQLPAGAAQS